MGDMLSVHTSRWGELMRGNITNFIFPKTVYLHEQGIKTVITRSLFMPWIKEDEHMVFRRVAGLRHIRGLIWDTVILESAGGSAVLEIKGLNKPKAQAMVNEVNLRISDPKRKKEEEEPTHAERRPSLSFGRLRRID